MFKASSSLHSCFFIFILYIYKHCISSLSSATGEDIPPLQLKEGVFRCIMQLYDCLLTEVHERCKKGLSLAKRLNSSLAFFCYDLLSIIEPRQVFELVYLLYLKVPSKFTVWHTIYNGFDARHIHL